MKCAAILALAVALACPVLAAEHGAKAEGGEKKEGEHGKKGGKPGTNVDMPFLMAPLTNADGKLTGYAYISSRLTAASESITTDVREKLPFIQDAFVRDVNGTSVALAADPNAVDIPGVEARLKTLAAKVMGPGKVKAIIVCTVQISPLRPAAQAPNVPADGAHADAKPPASRCES